MLTATIRRPEASTAAAIDPEDEPDGAQVTPPSVVLTASDSMDGAMVTSGFDGSTQVIPKKVQTRGANQREGRATVVSHNDTELRRSDVRTLAKSFDRLDIAHREVLDHLERRPVVDRAEKFDEMDELMTATSAAFDQVVLTMMIEHHSGVIEVG